MSAVEEEARLENFTNWLQINGAQLRGCSIKYCGPGKGYGVFFTAVNNDSPLLEDGVLMVVPLDLAITPMRVLQDPLLGPVCSDMYKEGDVDDRLLLLIFLTVERLRPSSPWKPYVDMLPTSFSSPLWFTDDELLELRGTSIYRATILQKKGLRAVFDNKAKDLITKILHLDGALDSTKEVTFEDFLWANSVFWTRSLNIPFPYTYVFPPLSFEGEIKFLHNNEESCNGQPEEDRETNKLQNCRSEVVVGHEKDRSEIQQPSTPQETVWAEGLVPGIDFCNHGLHTAVTWEVDNSGGKSGIPISMYLVDNLVSAGRINQSNQDAAEVLINYGNKGNEELLYLYGFVMNDNPDDYLMVHYPADAFQSLPLADAKMALLEIQKAELRYLLPSRLLDHGFFSGKSSQDDEKEESHLDRFHAYSWSGNRKVPFYLNKLVFPEEFLFSLRTVAMKESELTQVTSMLEELIGCGGERQPTDKEVQAAIWEVCGDSGAMQLLVDLLQSKLMELEEGSGTEASDAEMLESLRSTGASNNLSCHSVQSDGEELVNRNIWRAIVYRLGQKQLARRFLREAEHVLGLSLGEDSTQRIPISA